MVELGKLTEKPMERLLLGPARVVCLGTNTYHAGGLYPMGCKSEPYFELPLVGLLANH